MKGHTDTRKQNKKKQLTFIFREDCVVLHGTERNLQNGNTYVSEL